MKKISLLILFMLLLLHAQSSKCGTQHFVQPFASQGQYTVFSQSTISKELNKEKIYTFLPKGVTTQVPVVFFFPRSNCNGYQEYQELIHFVVSNGYALIFPPSYLALDLKKLKLDPKKSTHTLLSQLVAPIKDQIDTSRVVFLGHGYGTSIIPSMARRIVQHHGWGKNGLLLHLLSVGYFHEIDSRELSTFPPQAHLLITSFEDDNINDPVIGKELFNRLSSINPSQKEWYFIPNARDDSCKLTSDFTTPYGLEGPFGEVNNLDYYGIYAPLGAALKGLFQHDTNAYTFAFGDGTQRAISMGKWENGTPLPFMIGTDYPEPYLQRKQAVNMWISGRNNFEEVNALRNARKTKQRSLVSKVGQTGEFISNKITTNKEGVGTVEVIPNPITHGYGAPGKYSVIHDSTIPQGSELPIRFFTPKGVSGQLPLIILLHGYSGPEYRYFQPLIEHLVSHGYAVLFPPYPAMPSPTSPEYVREKIALVRSGIVTAFDTWKERIDTSRVLVSGQSFGAGMAPTIAHELFVTKKWGSVGAGLFLMAPWYTYDITDAQYAAFPKHTNVVLQVCDEDVTNDHAMAVDIFNSFTVSPRQKKYMILFSDSYGEDSLVADHFVSYGSYNVYGEEDNLDYYGVFRPFQALADYTFSGDSLAYPLALGNETPDVTYMGLWAPNKPVRPYEITDTPIAYHPQTDYFFPWDSEKNPRRIKKK